MKKEDVKSGVVVYDTRREMFVRIMYEDLVGDGECVVSRKDQGCAGWSSEIKDLRPLTKREKGL